MSSVSLSYQNEPPSPAGPLTVVAVESKLDDAAGELWVWDSVRGGRQRVWSFRQFALGTWSADGGWLAVTDIGLGRPSRCVVIDVTRGTALDLTETMLSLPRVARPPSLSDRLDCEIFGWLRDDPARVAVIFRNYGATSGEAWNFNFFFDVAAGRLFAAESR